MNVQASLDQLPRFAEQFWAMVGDSKVFAFHGPMGAGKTTIIEALCAYRGVRERMGSPTFSIINEYDCGGERIFHIDLYRLKDEQEIIQAGVEDCVYSGNICMVEWPDKAPHLFDEDTVHVYIQPESANERSVSIQMPVVK